MADEVDFAVQLVDRVTAPGREMTATIKRIIKSTEDLDRALRDVDDAMGHQKWVAFKRGEAAAQKAAAAAKLHADGLARVEGLGVPLDQMAKGPLLGLAKAGALAAAAVAAAAVAVVVKMGAAATAAASFAQKSRLALTQLTGSSTVAAAEFDAVRKMSQRFGLDVDETQKSFQKLLAAQFSIGQAKDLIKMGADLQVVTGEAESAQRALLTLTQIKAKGKLQGEELMQLQEAGVAQSLIMEALEKATGKTRDEVQKLLSAGKIDAATGVAAIIEAIKHKVGEKELGEAGANFADNTLEGMLGKLKGGLRNALIDMGDKILPALTRIMTMISGTIERLQKNGKLEQLGGMLAMGFRKFAEFIETAWPSIESAIVTTLGVMIKGIDLVITALDFMANNWSTIKAILIGVGAVVALIIAPFALMAAACGIVIAAVVGLVAALGFVIGWLVTNAGSLFESARNWASNLIDGFVQGVNDFADKAISAAAGLGNRIAGAVKSALGISSPSKVFAEMGMFSVQGFAEGMAANDVGIQTASADMAGAALLGVDGGGAAPAGGGGGPISITVNLTGAELGANPEQQADGIAQRIRRELQLIFEAA